MAGKTSDWRPGPTVCRCCLTEGCYKDISTEYFWMGKREVYAEMLSDTFNVSISYAQTGGRLICEPCIARLRDASDFKRQVQDCEKTFMIHLDPSTSKSGSVQIEVESVDDVKMERVKVEKDESDDDDFPGPDFGDDDDDDDLDDEPLQKYATAKVKVPKKEAVEILDMLDTSQITVKRKASSKTKEPPKKVKKKEVVVKPTTSKAKAAAAAAEKKKKGNGEPDILMKNIGKTKSRGYKRSPKSLAQIATKNNADSILRCWTVTPFRWKHSKFLCAYCDRDFIEYSLLRDHIRICTTQHTIYDIYKKFKEMPLINVDVTDAVCCCSVPFTDIDQMREHVINHGFIFDTTVPDGILPFALNDDSWDCFICKESFNNFLKLYEHMNVHYQHYICSMCGKGFMTPRRLGRHTDTHTNRLYPCDECGKKFTLKEARDRHILLGHGSANTNRYSCPHCQERFRDFYQRMAHLKTVHNVKEILYNCNHCDMTFNTSTKRSRHIRYVHLPDPLKFICSECGMKFRRNHDLKRHFSKHDTVREKEFQCNDCSKSYFTKKALSVHLNTHHSKIQCDWCDISFKDKNQLMMHLKANHDDLIVIISQ